MRSFLRTLNSVSLTEAVLDRAAEIRSSDRLQLADALIAACALKKRCTPLVMLTILSVLMA
jgi:predicted nucleic acid-binding protein